MHLLAVGTVTTLGVLELVSLGLAFLLSFATLFCITVSLISFFSSLLSRFDLFTCSIRMLHNSDERGTSTAIVHDKVG